MMAINFALKKNNCGTKKVQNEFFRLKITHTRSQLREIPHRDRTYLFQGLLTNWSRLSPNSMASSQNRAALTSSLSGPHQD